MLYSLGSHRWLWGRGVGGTQRANALPPVSLGLAQRSVLWCFTASNVYTRWLWVVYSSLSSLPSTRMLIFVF